MAVFLPLMALFRAADFALQQTRRTGDRLDEEPVSRVMREIVEVVLFFPQEGIQQCSAVVPQQRLSERIVEQIGVYLPHQFEEEIVKDDSLMPHVVSSAPWRRTLMW